MHLLIFKYIIFPFEKYKGLQGEPETFKIILIRIRPEAFEVYPTPNKNVSVDPIRTANWIKFYIDILHHSNSIKVWSTVSIMQM